MKPSQVRPRLSRWSCGYILRSARLACTYQHLSIMKTFTAIVCFAAICATTCRPTEASRANEVVDAVLTQQVTQWSVYSNGWVAIIYSYVALIAKRAHWLLLCYSACGHARQHMPLNTPWFTAFALTAVYSCRARMAWSSLSRPCLGTRASQCLRRRRMLSSSAPRSMRLK